MRNEDFGITREEPILKYFYLIETGTYRPVHYRPYQFNTTSTLEDIVAESLEAGSFVNKHGQHVQRFTAKNLSGRVLDFFHPSTEVRDEVRISGGWGERRYRWFMEIHWVNPISPNRYTRQCIVGSTDPMELSYNGLIDPDVTFTVNSSFDIDVTQSGVINLNESDQFFNDKDYAGLAGSRRLQLMRPGDIMQINSLPEHYRNSLDRSSTNYTSGVLTATPDISKRAHNNTARYIADIIDVHGKALTESDPYAIDDDDITSAMINNSTNVMSNNKFISFLRSALNSNRYENTFTYDDILDIFPSADDVKEDIRPSRDAERSSEDWMLNKHDVMDGETDHLDGRDHRSIVAAMIASALPDIALECFLTKVAFTVHNQVAKSSRDIYGDDFYDRYDFKFATLRSLVSNEPHEFVDNFKTRTIVELFDNITRNNTVDFHLTIVLDVFEDIKIELWVDDGFGAESYRYCYPTFCDNLYSHVITDNRDDLANITETTSSVLSRSADVYYESKRKHSFGDSPSLDEYEDDGFGTGLDNIGRNTTDFGF